ncbi:zinc-binding dehydrogenase [Biscogniauxia mediterranea]|nr:zinc-binding dehydrogenase [Biscogniauxia mediterranea]
MPATAPPTTATLTTVPIPSLQRAVIQDQSGRPVIVEDKPIPALRPGTLLIKTAAVALNPSDYKMGSAFPSPGALIGMDFAGHVVKLDTTRPDLNIGDAVCGLVHGSNPADHEGGSFAEYVLVPADLVLKVPEGFPLEQAATLGTAVFTACASLWGSLKITVSPDDPAKEPFPVLIYGASTASGTMATQLVRLSGLDPIVTCSSKNFDLVKAYGAQAVFDYTSPDVAREIRSYTKGRLRHALDCITCQESTTCCFNAIGRPGGRYACLEACPAEWKTRDAVKAEFVMSLEVFGKEVKLGGEYGRPADPEKHDMATEFVKVFQRLFNEGSIKPHPVEIVGQGFDSVLKGLTTLKSGGVSGKKLVVLLK